MSNIGPHPPLTFTSKCPACQSPQEVRVQKEHQGSRPVYLPVDPCPCEPVGFEWREEAA